MKFYLYSNKGSKFFYNKLICCDYNKKTFAIYTKCKGDKHPDIWEEIDGYDIRHYPKHWKEIDLKTVVILLDYDKLLNYEPKPKRNAKTGKRTTRTTRVGSK